MHTKTKDTAELRAAARANWPVRQWRLGEEPAENLTDSTTAAERVAMVEALSVEAWSLSRRLLPDYRRENAPVRVVAMRTTDD